MDLSTRTAAPRGSKDDLTWWWTIAPEAVFTLHPLDPRVPLTEITGGIRIPSCQNESEAQVTLTLGSGETLIMTANPKTTTEFSIPVKDPSMAENTLVVSTDLVGCKPADSRFLQYVQVINLTAL